jgi:hypothetical protein
MITGMQVGAAFSKSPYLLLTFQAIADTLLPLEGAKPPAARLLTTGGA